MKSRFEEHHNVKYAVAALQAAAELSAKYINDRHLPDNRYQMRIPFKVPSARVVFPRQFSQRQLLMPCQIRNIRW